MEKKYHLMVIILIILISCGSCNAGIVNKNIDSIILTYRDNNKLSIFSENSQNIPYEEHWDLYFAIFTDININEQCWDKIVNTINESKYSLTNFDFINKYKFPQPIYTIKIIYKNGYINKIDIIESLMNINGGWYEATDESKEILSISKDIINNFQKNETYDEIINDYKNLVEEHITK
jgi:hypothetical protein